MDERYYKELSKLSLLSQEDTLALFERLKAGDEKAADEIVKANLRLVIHFVKGYSKLVKDNDTLDINDLIGEGNLGLLQAVSSYEPSKGTSFSYYARVWIKKQIIECLLNNLHTIRSPWHKQKSDSNIRKMISNLEQERLTEINEDAIRSLGIYKDDDITHFYNKAEVTRFPDGYEEIESQVTEEEPDEIRMIKLVLNQLQPRERKVIKAFFGIDTEKKTLTMIGKELNLSKERVRQIKEKAIQKVRIIWMNR